MPRSRIANEETEAYLPIYMKNIQNNSFIFLHIHTYALRYYILYVWHIHIYIMYIILLFLTASLWNDSYVYFTGTETEDQRD